MLRGHVYPLHTGKTGGTGHDLSLAPKSGHSPGPAELLPSWKTSAVTAFFFPLILCYSKYSGGTEQFVTSSQVQKLRVSTRNFYGTFTCWSISLVCDLFVLFYLFLNKCIDLQWFRGEIWSFTPSPHTPLVPAPYRSRPDYVILLCLVP